MPFAPLGERHVERLLDRVRHAARIVRVDERAPSSSRAAPANVDRISTPGSSGSCAATIFLGDEVHAVAQRRHEADLRAAR